MKNIQLNNIEMEIVQFLFKYQENYQSSQSIAESIQVSSKTVRKYIKSLNKILKDFDVSINMKKGSGYQIKITNYNRFYQLLDLIRQKKNTMEDSKLLIDNPDRERYILNLLLLENKQVTIDELTNLMYISKSTVSSVIQMIKKQLKEFNLSISYDTEDHILIRGEEINKRRFILNYFFSFSVDKYKGMDLFDYDYEGFSIETIFIIVLEKCREFEIKLSDLVVQNLVLHIALAIKRNEKGFILNEVNVDEKIEYRKELLVAEEIVASIERIIDIHFSKDEAKYIAIHLKSNNQQLIKENSHIKEASLQNQLEKALMNFQSESAIDFMLDQQLIKGLKTHFGPLLTRLELNINLENPLLDEIKQKYLKVFTTTKKYLSQMPILDDYKIDDHEWAYISLHILAAIERYKQEHKMNIIVICATGLGSAQMLKNRLENAFSTNINIQDVISYHQLSDEKLRNIDLIISTIDISTSFYSVPVINVSVFLNQQDTQTLNKYIDNFTVMKKNTKETEVVVSRVVKLFKGYFDKERFIVFDTPTTREEALDEMILRLTDASETEFIEKIKNQIQIREKLGTLAFTDEVAFPHPAQPIGTNGEIVLGLMPNGIIWDNQHTSVKMIVLISPSKIENKGLDKINSGLAEFITSKGKVDLTLEGASFEQFRSLFLSVMTDQ